MYLTGAFALLVVGMSAGAALVYAITHGTETLKNLATSTLSGIGIALGGCIGSALIMRFQAARGFVKKLLDDVIPDRDAKASKCDGPCSGPTTPQGDK